MNITFDLVHPADVNLFKNAIYILNDRGHSVSITFRKRGILEKIIRNELQNLPVTQIGIHKKKLVGKIISGIQRELQCFRFFKENKTDIVVCQGLSCGLSAKMGNVRVIHYDDDAEYKFTYFWGKLLSDIDIMPHFMPGEGSNIVKYKGFKELAYLHPDYFIPDQEALQPYGVKPGEYVFIREISNVSVNYQHERVNLKKIVSHLRSQKLKIILSLENKQEISHYEKECIILQEPVTGLHSLIYHSRFSISSGDTMARESSLLGVPCIYTGGRDMAANNLFIESGVLYKMESIAEILEKIDQITDPKSGESIRRKMNEMIRNSFEDTNKVILEQINKLEKKKNEKK